MTLASQVDALAARTAQEFNDLRAEMGALVAPGFEVVSSLIASPTAMSVNNTYVTQGQLVVPAGTPAHKLEVVNGLLFQIQTGTQPVNTSVRADVAWFDELGTLLCYNAKTFTQHTTAVSKSEQISIPAEILLGAAAVDKTYTLQTRGFNIVTNGAAVSLLLGGAFPGRWLRAVYR